MRGKGPHSVLGSKPHRPQPNADRAFCPKTLPPNPTTIITLPSLSLTVTLMHCHMKDRSGDDVRGKGPHGGVQAHELGVVALLLRFLQQQRRLGQHLGEGMAGIADGKEDDGWCVWKRC